MDLGWLFIFAFYRQYEYNYTFKFAGANAMAVNISLDRKASSLKEKGGSLRALKFFLIGIFLLLQVYLFFFKNVEVLDYSRYINEEPLPLFGENKNVSQGFRTPGPLARIDIMMANYKIKPKNSTLRLSIFKENQRLFLKNYPANTVEDNRFYSFKISSKKIHAGNYRLQLNYFPQDKKEKLAAWSSKKDLYPYGSLYVNEQPQPGDMTFRVYYGSTIWQEKARWLSESPKSGFRSFALVIGFILLLLMVSLLFYYFLSKLLDKSSINDNY